MSEAPVRSVVRQIDTPDGVIRYREVVCDVSAMKNLEPYKISTETVPHIVIRRDNTIRFHEVVEV